MHKNSGKKKKKKNSYDLSMLNDNLNNSVKFWKLTKLTNSSSNLP